MAKKYYVVGIYGDVEPMGMEPFNTPEERDAEARRMYRDNDTDDGGIFRLDIDENGVPDMNGYTEDELRGEDDEK